MNPTRLLPPLVALSLLASACTGLIGPAPSPTAPAPTEALPAPTATPAPVGEAPEGPTEITGSFTYTNDIITTYYVEQAVALVDMYGFVLRDLEWEIPVKSQTLGYLDLDAENMVGEYWLQLPAEPDGTFADVDNDGQADEGVQILAVTYWPNLTGGPFSEADDPSFGWPSYLASVKTDSENHNEVIGGKLVVWSPDDGQAFPTGFGDDGLLFTDDDPVGPIPAGYSIVDLDESPFAVSQEADPELELFEPKDAEIKDYSDMSYTEAFENLWQKASTEWAFNDVPGKEVDWQALRDEIAPRVAAAEADGDALEFFRAIHDFTYAIPDGHTGVDGGDLQDQDFNERTEGGYGFAIRETDDGKVIVVYLTQGGPAQEAGMELGAEVTEFDDLPIAEAIGQAQPYSGPFSLETSRRYQQTRYLLRTAVGAEASVTFVNPGGSPQTATLTAVAERDSFSFSSIFRGFDANALPVEFRILDSGIGYIRLNSNYDDLGLIMRLFERALQTFQANGVAGLIIDMRQNSGGANLGLAGFLYDEEIPLGQLEYYSQTTGQFEPEGLREKVRPQPNQYQFDKIAVMVGQACSSACELEAYGFAQIPGAIVVGAYPSAGIEAEVSRGQYRLPEGISLQFPTGRFRDANGDIFLEGVGVQPTVRVPLTAENLLSEEDVELKAAEDAILGVGEGDLQIEGGPAIGSPQASEAAFNANTSLLEQAAAEQYDPAELSQAGETYVYTIQLDESQRLLWQYGWCTTSRASLDENFEHIVLEFSANGTPVDLSQFAVDETASGGFFCKTYYAVVFNWPSGDTLLETQVTFDAEINDGTADYPAGTHSFIYTVTLP